MIFRPYGSEKFDKLGFETFYGAINFECTKMSVTVKQGADYAG